MGAATASAFIAGMSDMRYSSLEETLSGISKWSAITGLLGGWAYRRFKDVELLLKKRFIYSSRVSTSTTSYIQQKMGKQ